MVDCSDRPNDLRKQEGLEVLFALLQSAQAKLRELLLLLPRWWYERIKICVIIHLAEVVRRLASQVPELLGSGRLGSVRSVGAVGFGSARLGFLSARLGAGAAGAERKLEFNLGGPLGSPGVPLGFPWAPLGSPGFPLGSPGVPLGSPVDPRGS